MKTAYLFHDIWTHYVKADWLAAHYPIDCFVIIKKTRPWWGKFLWMRARRLGFSKVFDEVILRIYWLLFKSFSDYIKAKRLLERIRLDIPENYVRPPTYHIFDINSSKAELLLNTLAPDVCVLTVHTLINENIFTVPRLGMLVFHPGITPEYRGPHSAFWATLDNQVWGIGWSLLRVNKGIDTGTVLRQGSATGIDPLTQTHIYMQHKSHVDGLPHVVDVLRRLERGEWPHVPTEGRPSTNHTHPGMTDYIKLRRVLKELRADSKPNSDFKFKHF